MAISTGHYRSIEGGALKSAVGNHAIGGKKFLTIPLVSVPLPLASFFVCPKV
jgi:hypothetical protein